MRAAGNRALRIAVGLSGFALAILVWWGVVRIFNIAEYVVAPPESVLASLQDDFPTLMRNLWPTVYESLLGFAIGNLIGIGVAVAFVHNRSIERGFFPLAVFIQTLPLVAVAPVLVLAFGNGLAPKVMIAALITLFPTLVNMTRGLSSLTPETIELFRVMSASTWDTFWKARTYASLPFLFTSLKIASTSSVIGAVVAEWVGADKGLGYLIINATYNFQTPLLYSTMFVTSLYAVLLFALISLIERRVIKWHVADN